MKKALAVFTIIILLFSASACSVHAQYATRGVAEFGGSIAYSSSKLVSDGDVQDNSLAILNFMPYVNYFIIDGFSIGLSPGVNMFKYTGYSAITNYNLFVVPGFTFSTGKSIFPYVEAMLGYTGLSSDNITAESYTEKLDNSGFSWGGKAGVKLLVGHNGLVSIGVSYEQLNFSAKGADKRTGVNNLAFSLGFSVFTGK
jgi:hypothetical protein